MPNNMEMGGARPQKETRAGVIFNNRFFSGLWSNRNPLRVPTGVIYEKFYKIGDDALYDGLNTEISNRLTLIRRPGSPQFSPVSLPAAPDVFSSFHELNGTIKVLADTATNVYIMGLQSSVTQVVVANNVATYTTSAAHGYTVGQLVTVTGCTTSAYNVTGATITAVTANTFTIALTSADNTEAESGALAGTLQSIFTKGAGAGQSFFQGVNQTLYFTDGVEQRKWNDFGTGVLGNNNNNTVNPTWLMGIVGPTTAPTVTPQSSGNTNQAWVASTFFSTMGLIIDSNGNIKQLTSVNANPVVNPNTTQIGTSGNGQPTWVNSPGGTTTEGGSSTVTWTCSATALTLWKASTFYPLYAVIYDPVTNACFYQGDTSPVLSGTSKPQFATTYLGAPTNDGNHIRWVYIGLPNVWQPGTAYAKFVPSDGGVDHANWFVCEPIQPTQAAILAGQLIYIQFCATAGTSNASYTNPNWPTTIPGQVGNSTPDGQLAWTFLGSATWASGTAYSPWSVTQNTFGVVVDQNGNFQAAIGTPGVSGPTEPHPYWLPGHVYALNYTIVDLNGNVQKVTTNGTSGASSPTWNTTPSGTTSDSGVTWTNQGTTGIAWGANYGAQTLDGTVTWVNVGPSANSAWKAASNYYLPLSGFFPPLGPGAFGSAAVKDSNGDIEYVVSSGFTGSSAPSWSATVGGFTTDNTGGGTDVGVTWVNNGLPSSLSFTYTQGYGYGYAFGSRTSSDIYTLNSFQAGTTPAILGVTSLDGTSPRTWLPIATGSGSGGVSTMSPATTFKGTNSAGAVIKITGQGSIDPQVDTIYVFRTVDGGATYFFLTVLPNPQQGQNGTPGTWNLYDATPDLQLNIQQLGDPYTVGTNHPPLTGMQNLIYFAGRLWGSIGNTVYASAGPDVGNPDEPIGNGFESWPAANQWPFASKVTRLVPINQGILVFTTSDLQIIGGGPSIAAYTSALLAPGYGLLSWNMLAQNGGQIFFYTADKRLMSFDPAGSLSEVGYPIGDQLSANFTPTNGYVAWHVNGSNDQALYIADGSSAWYRGNTSLSPDQGITGGICWSPKATINGGAFRAINSVETAPGVRQLLIGQSGAGKVMQRDSSFTTFTDLGSSYEAYATIGGIVLCNPGQMAELDFICGEFIQVGTSPKVLIRLDEISGAFEDLSGYVSGTTGVPPQDPPLVYGFISTPASIWANRYYFAQSIGGAVPEPTAARFIFIKVDFGSADTVQNEALTTTIFGKYHQEA